MITDILLTAILVVLLFGAWQLLMIRDDLYFIRRSKGP